MFRFKKLTQDSDLETYIESFHQSLQKGAANTRSIPLEYMRSAEVTGIFNHKEEMVGGYTLKMAPPLRLLEFVPEDKLSSLLLPKKFCWEDCCEVVCVWKKKDVPTSFMAKHMWPRVLQEILDSKSRFLLGHNQSVKLDRHYGVLGPRTLYKGSSSVGLPSHLFCYGRSKIRFMKLYSLTLLSLTSSLKERKKKWNA